MENPSVLAREREVDGPPIDDICPICFGEHTNPCKSNCGHWFCAGCILQWWDYRAVVQQCKCPLCCCKISKLTLKTSVLNDREEDVAVIIKRVKHYNSLYAGGLQSLLLKMMVLPLFVTKRILRRLMNPDHLNTNYYLMRCFAIILTCLYEKNKFDFIPTGGLQIRQLFELCAVILVIMLCVVGSYRREMQRRRLVQAAVQLQHL